MSWGIGEDALARQELQPGSQEGAFRDAIMFASRNALLFAALSNDPDLQNGRFVPANFPNCFKISSYSLSTEKRIESEHYDDTLYFPAEGLELSRDSDYFTDSTVRISGTSYATALAAGTAALLLVCVRVAYGDKAKDHIKAKLREFKRPEGKIRSIFTQNMRLSANREHGNLVAPWHFFRGDRWDSLGTTSEQTENRLKQAFDSII
jgi:Subtilase family